jgi:hypothetical protein
MGEKSGQRESPDVNDAVGIVAELNGSVGQYHVPAVAIFLMVTIWIVGAMLVTPLTDPPNKNQSLS